MSALVVFRSANAAGVFLARKGDCLMLYASLEPPPELLQSIEKYKPDLLSLVDLRNSMDEQEWAEILGMQSVPPPAVTVLATEGNQGSDSVGFTPSAVGGLLDAGPWPHLRAHVASLANRHAGAESEEESVLRPCVPELNPDLPWPQPGDTLLPGWGGRVSMEYRLRTASDDECLEWAKELWQLELVAKARGYPKKWASQIARNRAVWREVFAARDEGRAPDYGQFSGRGGD